MGEIEFLEEKRPIYQRKFNAHKMKSFPSKGFTLIELLVVIAIISLLSTIAMSGLSSARMKARDAKRFADLRSIRTAIALYYDDQQQYPPGGWICSYNTTNWNILQTALSPYLATLPKDPKNTGNPWITGQYAYCYLRTVSGDDYDLVTQIEDTSNPNICSNKGWLFHYLTPDSTWCGIYSPYLYADH